MIPIPSAHGDGGKLPASRVRVLRGEFVFVKKASEPVAAANADQVFPID
jgi:hypothetical protein